MLLCINYISIKLEKKFNRSDHCRMEVLTGVNAEQPFREAAEGTPPFAAV